jgi:SNF2 family DNA or RNA helicase
VPWDLIVLDEGQRIKNWEAKTSAVIKSLRSPYALVLSGTPLENKLDDLFSVVEFIDDRRLGAAFRFYNRHRVVDEKGKVLGYKNLSELRERLKPVLLRRTRASVLQELPPRTTEVLRIAPTGEQADICAEQMRIVSAILRKKFINEMDLLRLQKALLMARMAANSTYLVHKEAPGFSSKLERLRELLEGLAAEEDRKIVLFSEWTTMLGLIEPHLKALGMKFVRLDGSIPQKKRQALVAEFRGDPRCRLFITTNAGSTGLNLQAANTVINVDLPWNPAVLEQRISRAHRMGQNRPVQVYILVTEDTIEEKLLDTLSAKHELAQAALDPDSDIDRVDMASGMEELKNRLEVLLGKAPEAPVDESVRQTVEQETAALAQHRERVAAAGGELLGAAFGFLAQILPETETDGETRRKTAKAVRESLGQCLETGEDGKVKLTVTLPDTGALDRLAEALGKLIRQ